MKKLFGSVIAVCFLTACPSKEEVKKMKEEVSDKKAVALKLLEAKDYSLESLLKIQEYFFEFSEKVHLVKVEKDAKEDIEKLIKQKGGAREFCKNYVLPLRHWQPLEAYCTAGTFYRCSPEIREYGNTLAKLKELGGSEITKALNKESACN